jgi:hypothetical protein
MSSANATIVMDDPDVVNQGGVDHEEDYAFVASMDNEPTSLDEALSGREGGTHQAR